MPIWLRNYTFAQIQKFYKDEAEAYKKAQHESSNKTTAIDSDGKINPAAFQKPTKSNYK